MRRYLFLVSFILCSLLSYGQSSFSDNFTSGLTNWTCTTTAVGTGGTFNFTGGVSRETCIYNTATTTNDQYSSAVISSLDASFNVGVGVRLTAATDGHWFMCRQGSCVVYERKANAEVVSVAIPSTLYVPKVGDTIRIEAAGNEVTAKANGYRVWSYTDTNAVSTGGVGLVGAYVSTGGKLATWTGGDRAAGALCGTPPTLTAGATSTTTTSFTINWTSNIAADTQLLWGLTDIGGENVLSPTDPSGVTSHSVTVSGLHPNTTYNYKYASHSVCNGGVDNLQGTGSADGLVITTSAVPSASTTYTTLFQGTHYTTQGSINMISTRDFIDSANANFWLNYTITNPNSSYFTISYPEVLDSVIGVYGSGNVFGMQHTSPYQGGYGTMIQINVSPSTPVGDYTFTFTGGVGATGGDVSGAPHNVYNFVLHVETGTPLTSNPPTSVPAGYSSYKATWDASLAGWGTTFLTDNDSLPNGADGPEQHSWYYAGVKGWAVLGDYLGDTTYSTTGATSAWNYYVTRRVNYNDGVSNCGGVGSKAWEVFSLALKYDYIRNSGNATRQSADLTAILNLNGNTGCPPGPYTAFSLAQHNGFGGMAYVNYIREMSYRADAEWAYKYFHDLGTGGFGTDRAYIFNRAYAMTIGNIEQISREGAPYQPFWNAIAAKTLIELWEDGYHDQRIPYAIKRLADFMWTTWMIDPEASYGGKCYETPDHRYWFYNSGNNGLHTCNSHMGTLNAMMAPMYSWVWQYTGDDTYRQRYDAIMQASADYTIYPNPIADMSSGKQLSEQTFWGIEGMIWRTTLQTGSSVPSLFYGNTVRQGNTVSQ